jgi:6-phosphogluconolactonase (cycloisomerase 2 family)
MGMRFRLLAGMILLVLLGLTACSDNKSGVSTGAGGLFVASQGDSSVSSFSIDLSAGTLTAVGKAVPTGNTPSAMVALGSALFVVNSNSSIPPNSPACTLPTPGTISAYTVNSDGTLAAATGTAQAGVVPVAMSVDSAGHFLFVANQGLQCDPNSSRISVFAIKGTALTEVTGSPFLVTGSSVSSGAGPSGLSVTPDGKFLFVTDQFDSTITKFSVDASGVLTQGLTVPVGTTPSATAITQDGGFLYVGNASTISAFAICNQVVTTCNDPANPDGSLTQIAGSPFSSGLGPTAIVPAPSGKFLFVVDRLSNQISQYKLATGTGVLTPNTQGSISTGATPVSAVVRAGTTTVAATGGTTNYLYVANLGGSSISIYTFDSTVGTLSLVGAPVTFTPGQPSAVAAE